MNGHAHNEKGPNNVQGLQRDQQAIEDVVGGEHGHHAQCHVRGVIDDAIGEETDARQHPTNGEHIERYIGRLLPLDVGQHFSTLQWIIEEEKR